MNKFFLSLLLLAGSLNAAATDYTGTLVVTVNGTSATQPSQISVEEQTDGTYVLQLKNFTLEMEGNQMPVGTIRIEQLKATTKDGVKGLAANKTITIVEGDATGVPVWIGPGLGEVPLQLTAQFTDAQLFCNIDITMASLGQTINVKFNHPFSSAFYQIQNSDFEAFGSNNEPHHWHSFASVGGTWAAFVKSTTKCTPSSEVREGTAGKSCVKVSASSILGIVANGNLTTGRVIAGSFTASDPANHNESDPAGTSVDENGHPFYQPFYGRPDSLVVWVKFIPGKATDKASVSAVITDNSYYQEPQETTYTNIVARAADGAIDTKNGEWQRLSLPFDYDSYSANKAMAANILVSFSTNTNPGSGSGSDVLYVDDMELIYKNDPLTTGITSVPSTTAPTAQEGIYTLDGRPATTLQPRRIYILKEAGKPARKISR